MVSFLLSKCVFKFVIDLVLVWDLNSFTDLYHYSDLHLISLDPEYQDIPSVKWFESLIELYGSVIDVRLLSILQQIVNWQKYSYFLS